MVAATIQDLGRVDICVNNAGATIRKRFLDLTSEDLDWVIAVCLKSVFHTSQACAREMVRRGEGGSILIISSVHAFIPFATSMSYNACKAGIDHMGYTMAEELRTYRIRVNTIQPGWIDTPGERDLATEEELKRIGLRMPWGRLGTPEEVGKAAAFLASPDADYITAACLRVDGGFWLPSRPVTLE
jgi:glucose 1-dehydrogenase